MSVTPDDLMCSARNHAESEAESDLRVAAHQAYYALYRRALCLATDCMSLKLDEGKPTHAQLSDFFHHKKNAQFKILGRSLRSAHHTRCLADYNLVKSLGQSEVRAHVVFCERGLSTVEGFIKKFATESE